MESRDVEDMSFDTLFYYDDDQAAYENPTNEVRSHDALQDTVPVSALTLTFERMEIEPQTERTNIHQIPEEEDGCGDVMSKWASVYSNQDQMSRLGASAPVRIPNKQMEWSMNLVPHRQHLDQIKEEGNGEWRTQNMALLPHLAVERPLIQFSLNSGIAERWARFRTREKILTQLGVNESTNNNYFHHHQKQPSDFAFPSTSPPTSGLTEKFSTAMTT